MATPQIMSLRKKEALSRMIQGLNAQAKLRGTALPPFPMNLNRFDQLHQDVFLLEWIVNALAEVGIVEKAPTAPTPAEPTPHPSPSAAAAPEQSETPPSEGEPTAETPPEAPATPRGRTPRSHNG